MNKAIFLDFSGFTFAKVVFQASAIIQFLAFKIYLDPFFFGIFTLVIIASNYSNFFSFGLIPWFSRYAPKYVNKRKFIANFKKKTISSVFFVNVLFAIFISLIVYFNTLNIVFSIISLSVVFQRSSINFFYNFYRALFKNKELIFFHFIISFINFSTFLLVSLESYSYLIFLYVFGLLLSIIFYCREGLSSKVHFNKFRFYEMLDFFKLNFVNQFILDLDKILITLIFPLPLVGLYNYSSTIVNGMFIAFNSYESYSYPKIISKTFRDNLKINSSYCKDLTISSILSLFGILAGTIYLLISEENPTDILVIVFSLLATKPILIISINIRNYLMAIDQVKRLQKLTFRGLVILTIFIYLIFQFNLTANEIKFIYYFRLIIELTPALIYSIIIYELNKLFYKKYMTFLFFSFIASSLVLIFLL